MDKYRYHRHIHVPAARSRSDNNILFNHGIHLANSIRANLACPRIHRIRPSRDKRHPDPNPSIQSRFNLAAEPYIGAANNRRKPRGANASHPDQPRCDTQTSPIPRHNPRNAVFHNNHRIPKLCGFLCDPASQRPPPHLRIRHSMAIQAARQAFQHNRSPMANRKSV